MRKGITEEHGNGKCMCTRVLMTSMNVCVCIYERECVKERRCVCETEES